MRVLSKNVERCLDRLSDRIDEATVASICLNALLSRGEIFTNCSGFLRKGSCYIWSNIVYIICENAFFFYSELANIRTIVNLNQS